jgi:Xaa-Pro aminopeptidase
MMKDDREGVEKNILQAMGNQDVDAVVATGVDNFTYMTGICLPFPAHFPDRRAIGIKTKGGESLILCPRDWEGAVQDQGWEGRTVVYSETGALPPVPAVETLARVLEELSLQSGRIGIDGSRVPSQVMDRLTARSPQVTWVASDDLFSALRLQKTPEEIRLIEVAARHSELGMIGALNHMEGSMDEFGYTRSEFSERIRVHAFEAGASGVGHVAPMQGVESQRWYAPAAGKFGRDLFVRMEVTNHLRGYWSNAARMFFTGQPTQREWSCYRRNVDLKRRAEEMLKPGVRCDEIFGHVKTLARKESIDLWEGVGIGHGVGVSEREGPYLHPADRTVLKPGMVLVLTIYSHGPNRELICSKDTYEISQTGCRLLSWHRNWDRLYAVTGFRAAH